MLCICLLSTGSSGIANTEPGAKALFNRQIAEPQNVLNTGLQYWIELRREGRTLKVSNKFPFKSGDQIRIHVSANADSYAYILLKEGSSGERSVLFPDSRFHDKNRITASKDYPLPEEGFLKFDEKPGTEKLILLISREKIDLNKYLHEGSKPQVVIASNRGGSKDLIPGSVVVAYSEPENNEPAKAPLKIPPKTKPRAPETDFVTTLVQNNPLELLAVELDLTHKP